MTSHGDPSRFALEFELGDDPDAAGDPATRASWGRLRIWVGRNLTRARTSRAGDLDAAEVSLLPLLRWLVDHWPHLVREEHLLPDENGTRGERSAARWYEESLREPPRDEDRMDELLEERERWWHRHSYSEDGQQIELRRVNDTYGNLDAGRLGAITKALNTHLDTHAWGAKPRGPGG